MNKGAITKFDSRFDDTNTIKMEFWCLIQTWGKESPTWWLWWWDYPHTIHPFRKNILTKEYIFNGSLKSKHEPMWLFLIMILIKRKPLDAVTKFVITSCQLLMFIAKNPEVSSGSQIHHTKIRLTPFTCSGMKI